MRTMDSMYLRRLDAILESQLAPPLLSIRKDNALAVPTYTSVT